MGKFAEKDYHPFPALYKRIISFLYFQFYKNGNNSKIFRSLKLLGYRNLVWPERSCSEAMVGPL